jgi:anti-sigma B factor antagonist
MSDVVSPGSEHKQIFEGQSGSIDMSAPSLEIDLVEDPGDSRRLVVQGELDMSTAPKLNGELIRAFRDESAQVVLDLRDISFIDSMGLGVLVSAKQRAKAAGVSMKFRLPDGPARFAFTVTGLADSFDDATG